MVAPTLLKYPSCGPRVHVYDLLVKVAEVFHPLLHGMAKGTHPDGPEAKLLVDLLDAGRDRVDRGEKVLRVIRERIL